MSDEFPLQHKELVWTSRTKDNRQAMLYHCQSHDGTLRVELAVGPFHSSYSDEELRQLGNGSLHLGVELLTNTVESIHGFDWSGVRLFDSEVRQAEQTAIAA